MSSGSRLLDGKVAVVTGATSGIGQETAVGLARHGAFVVLVGRNAARADAAVRDVRERAQTDAVDATLADFESLDAVRELAGRLRQSHPAVHILVNNAGVVMTRRQLTVDGHETTLAVNHLAPFLLTQLLREPLIAGQARVVNVSSHGHKFVSGFDFDDPMSERRYGFPSALKGMVVYSMSKLANVLFTTELARRMQGTGVTTNALHPGAVATRLGQNNGAVGELGMALVRPFFKTPEQGAATSLHVATSPGLESTSGRYFADCREQRTSAAARDAEAAARLWRESCRWVGLDEAAGA